MISMFLIAGCSNEQATGNVVKSQPTTSPATSQGDIKLGWIGPLTGEAASFGQNALAGATLAVNEINAQGGINGRQIKLITEDDKCSAAGVSAMQKLVNANNVDAIVGPACSASAGPAVPIAVQAGTPVMMFSASAPGLTALGDRVFRVYPSDSFQGKEAAKFMFETLGARKVAIAYVQNDWGLGIQKVFAEEFKRLGGQVLTVESSAQGTIDFRTEIAKIKNLDVDAVYSPLYVQDGVAFVKQAKEAGLNVPLVGGDGWTAEEFLKSGQTEGAIFTVAKIDEPEAFKARVHAVKGFESVDANLFASLGYDAVKVTAAAMQRAGTTDKVKVTEQLYKTSYRGISSPSIEFDSEGDMKVAVYEVKQVRNNGAVPYQG